MNMGRKITPERMHVALWQKRSHFFFAFMCSSLSVGICLLSYLHTVCVGGKREVLITWILVSGRPWFKSRLCILLTV